MPELMDSLQHKDLLQITNVMRPLGFSAPLVESSRRFRAELWSTTRRVYAAVPGHQIGQDLAVNLQAASELATLAAEKSRHHMPH